MDELLTDKSQIKGLIYIIKNSQTQKNYIGQTLTHRKNKNKYRPFGILGRFNDHVSEALCNTKKKQCTYLNNSIRQYGKEAFDVSLLKECPIDELDNWEQYYIKEYNTYFPNGYNLTYGGKTTEFIKTDYKNNCRNPSQKRGGCKFRSDETKNKIKQRLKEVMNTQEIKEKNIKNTRIQHENQKYERFRNLSFDKDNLDNYLHIRSSKGTPFIRVRIGKIQTDFVSKYQTIEELKDRAIKFLQSI